MVVARSVVWCLIVCNKRRTNSAMKSCVRISLICLIVLAQFSAALVSGAGVVCVGSNGHVAIELSHGGECETLVQREVDDVVTVAWTTEGCEDSTLPTTWTTVYPQSRKASFVSDFVLNVPATAWRLPSPSRSFVDTSVWHDRVGRMDLTGITILQV